MGTCSDAVLPVRKVQSEYAQVNPILVFRFNRSCPDSQDVHDLREPKPLPAVRVLPPLLAPTMHHEQATARATFVPQVLPDELLAKRLRQPLERPLVRDLQFDCDPRVTAARRYKSDVGSLRIRDLILLTIR